MDISELRSEVAERYERLGLPSWPDPHPHLTPPKEEEYSRVTDPARYRLAGLRARAWVDALVSAGLGSAEPVEPAEVTWAGEQRRRCTRAVRVRGADGTQPILVGWGALDDVADAVRIATERGWV